jgi:ABC-type glutathione transport system ATPase component
VEGLSKSFAARGVFGGLRGSAVPAVQERFRSTSRPARQLALVGESGSGKTTTARLVLRLLAADAGRVTFDGVDWLSLPAGELRRKRREMSVVFQDPATSLNPRLTVERLVGEPLEIHGVGTRTGRRERVRALLARVGLPEAALSRTPREFSGGQRQRIGIARALATEPRLVVLDEPVSALDVSVRAQVLNLLLELQETTPSRPAYLFIGHDLAVVRLLAPRTAVMFRGQIVEEGPTGVLFASPRHPHTRLLLAPQPAAHPPRESGQPWTPWKVDLPPCVAASSGALSIRGPLRGGRAEKRPWTGTTGSDATSFMTSDFAIPITMNFSYGFPY